ncbi:MAG: lipopolysaccharide biosynthesis protein [Planctomycetota bacterium]
MTHPTAAIAENNADRATPLSDALADDGRPDGTLKNLRADEVGRLAARSAKWAFLANLLPLLTQPVVNVVLARVLLPQDYGIVALASGVTALAGIFQGMGLSQALIRRTEEELPRAASVAFSLNASLGATAYAVVFLFAPLIARFLGEPRLVAVLRVQGLTLLVASLASVQIALLHRSFLFRRLFWLYLVPALSPLAVALPLAALGFGYWALVASALTATALQTALLWISSPWRPRLVLDLGLALSLLSFGGLIALETLQNWATLSGANLIIGRALGPEELGRFVMAFYLATTAVGIWIRPLSALVYASLCRLREDPARMRSAYLDTLRVLATTVLPASVGLSVLAGRIVPLLLGPRWTPIVPVVRIFAILPGLEYVLAFKADVYRAAGRPDIMPRFNFVEILYVVPAYLLAARFGILAISWVRFSSGALLYLPHVLVTARLLSLPRRSFWRCLRAPLAGSLMMGAVLLLFDRFLGAPASALPGWTHLLFLVLAGFLTYAGGLFLLDRSGTTAVLGTIKRCLR